MKPFFNKCLQLSPSLLAAVVLAAAGLSGCGGGGGSGGGEGVTYSTSGNVDQQTKTTVTSSSWVAPVMSAASAPAR